MDVNILEQVLWYTCVYISTGDTLGGGLPVTRYVFFTDNVNHVYKVVKSFIVPAKT